MFSFRACHARLYPDVTPTSQIKRDQSLCMDGGSPQRVMLSVLYWFAPNQPHGLVFALRILLLQSCQACIHYKSDDSHRSTGMPNTVPKMTPIILNAKSVVLADIICSGFQPG